MRSGIKSALSGAALVLALALTGCGGGGGSDSSPGYTAGTALTGSYGGIEANGAKTPATLALTANNGQITLPCGAGGQISAPLVPDGSGHAAAAGTYSDILGVPSSSNPLSVNYTATVIGKTLTLTVTNTQNGSQVGVFTLIQGQSAPPFNGACPG